MVAALLAALCYAVGAALEQKEASATATQRVVHPGLLWQVLRRPVWLAGFAVMGVGEVLHVLALAWAPLAVVQPIGVTTVLFALPHRGPSRPPPAASGELAAAAVTVAGLAALLTGMKVSTAEPALSGHDLAVLAPAVGGGLAVLTLVALRASGALRTLLLGCGSGVAFGATAALVRLLTHRVELHGVSGLVGWVSPVIAVTAVAGLLLEQGAYKSGHLGVAVAGYTVTDPLVAVALGAWVLHQPARASHPLWAAGEALVVMTGVILLARATTTPSRRLPRPQAGWYRASSRRATDSRCTSSGPSAIRSARPAAYSCASGTSPDSPSAPCTWIARSMISAAARGTAALMAAISIRAPLGPAVSSSQAVFWTSSRSCSIVMRASAMSRRTAPCSASVRPNAVRDSARRAISSSARSLMPIARMQWCTRPGPRRLCATAKPAPAGPSRLAAGTRAPSKRSSQCP